VEEAFGGGGGERRRRPAVEVGSGGRGRIWRRGRWPTAVEGMMPRPPLVGGPEEVEERGVVAEELRRGS
jgi:hypothetical protein